MPRSDSPRPRFEPTQRGHLDQPAGLGPHERVGPVPFGAADADDRSGLGDELAPAAGSRQCAEVDQAAVRAPRQCMLVAGGGLTVAGNQSGRIDVRRPAEIAAQRADIDESVRTSTTRARASRRLRSCRSRPATGPRARWPRRKSESSPHSQPLDRFPEVRSLDDRLEASVRHALRVEGHVFRGPPIAAISFITLALTRSRCARDLNTM